MKRFMFQAGRAGTCALFLWSASPGDAAEFKFPTQTIVVPDGFEVELVAGPPLVDRPITADFDELGRLYVADSSGSNDPVKKQLEELPHRIVMLEDTTGDGKFDKSTVFADRMMFPEGTMWYDGSLYVAAPPSIWKLTDTTGDGVADQREEWFMGKTLTGCANDLHGPYLGLDGWIYWCKGAFARQTYERSGGEPFVTRAAHIFRVRPDGTGIEPVMTGGMDNPVDVVFTPEGERIFTTTFFQHPGGGRRDGLIHAIYGGVYGKVHDVIEDHPRTGEVMPVLTHLGPSAPSGLHRYSSGRFGPEYENNLFAALFNTRTVTRHVLVPDGATFKTRDEDFLVSDNPDFHPTDVIEDADGSLLVIDTGGWYKICCPTSQLEKPDVLGAIYRVRRTGAAPMNDARGLNLDWAGLNPAELGRLLEDDRPAVRQRAIHELFLKGNAAVPELEDLLKRAQSEEGRRNAVWALTRVESDEARRTVRVALEDASESVRHAATHSVALWRDREALPQLIRQLESDSLHLKRVAAEALGRIGESSAVEPLLKAGPKSDRVLEHSIIYALIEIGSPEAVRKGLAASDSRTRRAAMIALDQMPGGGIAPEEVTPLLGSSDPVLKETASWIVARHPDWGAELAGFLRERLQTPGLDSDSRREVQQQLAQFGRSEPVQVLMAEALASREMDPATRMVVLRAMSSSRVREVPAQWIDALVAALREQEVEVASQVVRTVRSLPAPKPASEPLAVALFGVAGRTDFSAELRIEALAAVAGGLEQVSDELLHFLCAHVGPEQPVQLRNAAANVLSRARLGDQQLEHLAEVVKTAGPMELPRLLAAFEHGSSEAVGLKLIEALKEAASASTVRGEVLTPHLKNYPATVQAAADSLLNALHTDAAQKRAHLQELLGSLPEGDIRRGQAIFNSPQTACSACHAIGYAGGDFGPDLTSIGTIRTGFDLLESIVYPNASLVRSYESIIVETRSGEEHGGILRRDAPDEVVLATGPGAEVRIPRQDIVEMRPGELSVMPGGLHEHLSPQELADLLAFLKNTRRGPQR